MFHILVTFSALGKHMIPLANAKNTSNICSVASALVCVNWSWSGNALKAHTDQGSPTPPAVGPERTEKPLSGGFFFYWQNVRVLGVFELVFLITRRCVITYTEEMK